VEKWIYKIRRLSLSQLKALWVLTTNKNGIVVAEDAAVTLGLRGKQLGGVFSSLSRQKIGEESLIEPWGRSEGGRGLRWKLNNKVIDREKLRAVLKEVLEI
jgi:hypothetical protein